MIVFRKNTANSEIAVWHITETEAALQQLLGEPIEQFCYKNATRRLEVLAERLLLKELCGESNFQHMESGKPFLDSGDMRISFSHTKNFVALIVSKECEVGIDIEYPSDRVCRVKERFLSSVEQSTFDDDAKKILLAWCAKEALYKVLNTPMLDFARQLQIQEFEVKTEGEILAKSELQRQQIHKLNYICTNDYYLVWVETSG